VNSTNGTSFYIPLAPYNAILSFSHTVDPQDLIFDASDPKKMETAIEQVIENYLRSNNYTNNNFGALHWSSVNNNGSVKIRFVAKHQPSNEWLGIKKDDVSVFYRPDGKNIFEDNDYVQSSGSLVFTEEYLTPCGEINLKTNFINQLINTDESGFDNIVLNTTQIPYTISRDKSFPSRTCRSSLLKVINPDCQGVTSYLWNTGDTTQTIPNKGVGHSVQVTCTCREIPCIPPHFIATDVCRENNEDQYYLEILINEGSNVPYAITNDLNPDTVIGYLNEPVEIGPFPNNSNAIVYVTSTRDRNCSIGISDFSGDCSPFAELGGDSDGDGICDDEDCAANDPSLPLASGTPCDDGDPNTTNDLILIDGCTCEGTPIRCVPPIFNVLNECKNNDTENFYLKILVTGGSGNKFYITNNTNANRVMTSINKPIEIGPFLNNWSVDVKVTSASDRACYSIQTKKTWTCAPCLLDGGDSDGDGICDDLDCDDWNPTIPGEVGEPCDDGDPNTENDTIQDDYCTCKGDPVPGSPNIIPVCGENEGEIDLDEDCSHATFEWSDNGSTNPDRENLSPGDYTVSITDKNGCIEELTFNIPDLSDCSFEVERNEIPNNASGSPCFSYSVTGTIAGIEIPAEFLQITWTVSGGSILTYYSSEPSVLINTQADYVALSVELVLPSSAEPCCTFDWDTQIDDADYCVFNNGEFLVFDSSDTSMSHSNEYLQTTTADSGEIISEENNSGEPDMPTHSLEIYPNPFNTYLNVKYRSEVEGLGKIIVFNSIGKIVYIKEVNCSGAIQFHQIDFSRRNGNGLYLIQIHYPNSKVKSAKAVYVDNQ
ncbi:MAG: T9SS type A sorting domain-containing protein, partial [Bacteroidota bacterium]